MTNALKHLIRTKKFEYIEAIPDEILKYQVLKSCNKHKNNRGIDYREIDYREIYYKDTDYKEIKCFAPQIVVPYDFEVVENEQRCVDAGHSPWKLDPKFVAQVFVSLLIQPEGITGDYPIKYDNLKVIQDDGVRTIIKINDNKSPLSFIYLKRLIRADETGIWTVIGYDLVK